MNGTNPLQIETLASVCKNKSTNNRGRPTIDKMIKFSPQPKSIISQMLCSELAKKEQFKHNDDVSPQQSDDTEETDFRHSDYEINSFKNSPEPVLSPSPGHKRRTSKTKKNKKKHKTDVPMQKVQEYPCDYPNCSYVSKLSSNLIKHKRIHTAEKPYLCDKCTFRSNFVNSLKVHKRIHTSERPYACQYCPYQCNSSSNLKKHCGYRHPHTQSK